MAMFRLVSESGDQSFELPPGKRIVVGRGLSSDVPLHDPTISRRHAELIARADGVQIKDLGSSNGTYVNGTKVMSGRIQADDAVTFGRLMFHLKAVAPPVSSETGTAGGMIVRQVPVTGGVPAGVTSREAPGSAGQLRVDAATAEARQAKKLSMLLDVSQKLSGEFDLDRLLRTVVDMTFEIMNVDRVTILLRDEATGELVPTISRTRQGDVQPQPVPRSIADKVVREGVAVVSHNAPADARFKGQSIRVQSVRSAMCSPLTASADRVLGLLYVDNITTANTFSDEDLQFLVAFSGIAAIGIKNSRYADQLRHESLVRSNFERYFAPNVAAEIAQQAGTVQLGGERRPITILFSDIRGFTAMAESMGPDAIAQLLSEYFTEMVDVIFDFGGTLDKFMGDAIMALWGAPLGHADDPDRALRAAMEMQHAVTRLNQRWVSESRPEIRVGIGINYGEVFAGNIGSHRRLDYTVIGDAVNVAARLCAAAGPGEVLVTESVLRVVRDPVEHEFLPEMALKGKTQVVEVYRLRSVGAPDQRTSMTSAVPLRPSKR